MNTMADINILSSRTLSLNDALRDKLKEPLGLVLKSPEEYSFDTPVAAVGDVTFHNLLSLGVEPFLAIGDMKTRRGKEGEWSVVMEEAKKHGYTMVELENPQGVIVPSAWEVIGKAIETFQYEGRRTFIHVLGEEDLLALVVIALIPEGWTVAYGMPSVGVHVVRVGKKEKNKTFDVLMEMSQK